MTPARRTGGLPVPDAGTAGRGSLLAGRYRLEERLCGPEEWAQWRAVDEALSRLVTVYVLSSGSGLVAEVMAAARAASRIDDPRLVRILDADDRADPPFVVTGWPSGACLVCLLAAGPLDPGQAAAMIAEATAALAAAHQAGLAHLCLGVESLWCGTGGEVMITGLGIDAALTGMRSADPGREDTGALGRLLYAALTGYWPGPGRSGLPPAPSSGERVCRPGQLRPGIPAAIETVICRALADPALGQEPAILTPAQLAAELTAVTDSRPPPGARGGARSAPRQAPTLPDMTASRHLARSRRVPLPAMLAVVFLVLAGLAAGGWLAARELSAPHHPPGGVTFRTLVPVSAAAFGPLGESVGDHPELARLAIDGILATAWHTSWYATASFGNLKPGTGLLLDMGHPVTITAAQVTLGTIIGADLQLRAGGQPAQQDLRLVAHAADVGGVLTIPITRPVTARYLLIWFTRLPPDGSGTYQANVYNVRLTGTA